MVKSLVDYSPEMQAEFKTLADNLTGAWENFRMDASIDDGKTERAVYDALQTYETIVPMGVRFDLAKDYRKVHISVFGEGGKYELSFGVRLRLEQIHNACFCTK